MSKVDGGLYFFLLNFLLSTFAYFRHRHLFNRLPHRIFASYEPLNKRVSYTTQ